MARELTDGTNVIAPDGTYIYGRVNDSEPRTVVNEALFGDLLVNIQKMMTDAGLTINSLPDNETNGYQIFQALFGGDWNEVGSDGGATSYANGWATATGPFPNGVSMRYRLIAGGTKLQIAGWASASSATASTAFTLPSGFRPDTETYVQGFGNAGSLLTVIIGTDGTVQFSGYASVSYQLSIEIPMITS